MHPQIKMQSFQKRHRPWRWCVLGLGLVWLGLVGCRTTQYTVVGSGGGVQLGPVEIELRAHGQRLPCFAHNGQFYVVGRRGMRYSLWIHNRTPQRLEVVASVDGRDVITGRRQQRRHRGYILNPYRYVNITGYRTSLQTVAAFRFSAIHRSYAARQGSAWYRVGSIVVSVYNERGRRIYGQPLEQPQYHSRRPSILRKRNYAPTPPGILGGARIVRKARPSYRYMPGAVAEPRLPDKDRGGSSQYAPPPSVGVPSKAPSDSSRDDRMAPVSPSPSRRSSARPSMGGSYGKSYSPPISRQERYSRRYYRKPAPSHNYHHPAPPEGLGTAFGERHHAPAQFTTFERASSHPAYVVKIMYNNCAAYRYIGLCTPWCPCYRAQPRPYAHYMPRHYAPVP